MGRGRREGVVMRREMGRLGWMETERQAGASRKLNVY